MRSGSDPMAREDRFAKSLPGRLVGDRVMVCGLDEGALNAGVKIRQ